MKKFAFIFACVSLSIVCFNAKAVVNVSYDTLNEIRRVLDQGEAFGFKCTDPMHEGKCAAAGFDNGEDKILFFKSYNNGWGHSILECQSGYYCSGNSCVPGTGSAICADVNIAPRCDGLRGDEKDRCISCSALSNWDTWEHVEKQCSGEPVSVSQDITITVTDTNGNPVPGVRVYYSYSLLGKTDTDGKITIKSKKIGDQVNFVFLYGTIEKNVTINSANMTVEMDVKWYKGMVPGQLREIDCTNADNKSVCWEYNGKTGIIGLDYDWHPISSIILECNTGYEWFWDEGNEYVDCRPGTGAARTTDFSEIAERRCAGLDDAQKASCIDCTKRDWNAWDYVHRVCNNNASPAPKLTGSNADDIEKIAQDLKTIASSFGQSRWKDKNGNFNTARLASDSIAGVVLGTAGGLITSHVIKNNQIKGGFENIQCVINGQVVSGYLDEFRVGIQ